MTYVHIGCSSGTPVVRFSCVPCTAVLTLKTRLLGNRPGHPTSWGTGWLLGNKTGDYRLNQLERY